MIKAQYLRIFMSSMFFLGSCLVPTTSFARPIEDIVREELLSKIEKCDIFKQIKDIEDNVESFDCPKAKKRKKQADEFNKNLWKTCQSTFSDAPPICMPEDKFDYAQACEQEVFDNRVEFTRAKETRFKEAIENACVVDEYSFRAIGELALEKIDQVDQKPPETLRKTFLNCTKKPQEHFETISLTIEEGYKIKLDKDYSNSSELSSTVSFSNTKTRSTTLSAGQSASIGVVSGDVNFTNTTTNTTTNSNSTTKSQTFSFSIGNSQTQERLSVREEIRPEQFTVPAMTRYDVIAKKTYNDVGYIFDGKVIADARVTVPVAKRRSPVDSFTSDGSAYLSEIFPEEQERVFEIKGTINERDSTDTLIVYKETPLTADECNEF